MGDLTGLLVSEHQDDQTVFQLRSSLSWYCFQYQCRPMQVCRCGNQRLKISPCGDKKPVPKSSGMFYSFHACKTRNNQDNVEKQGQLEESGICLLPFQTLCLLSFKLDFAGVNIGNNARTGMNTEITAATRRPKGRRSKKPKKKTTRREP